MKEITLTINDAAQPPGREGALNRHWEEKAETACLSLEQS